MAFTAAIAGASGYAGGELLRLLANHPDIEVTTVTANSNAGSLLGSVHPNLRTFANLQLQPTTPEVLSGHDVVFFALPHGHSGALAGELEQSDPESLLIDCGADHRLESESKWNAFYGGKYHPNWTYGVPELPILGGKQRIRLVGTKRIAAPGCNASAISLALAPGVTSGLIDTSDLVATLAVGPSGAGRSLKTHLLASELLGNARPYSVAGTHRHIPEVAQALNQAAAAVSDSELNFGLSLTPILVPMSRGILACVTAPVVPGTTSDQIRDAWQQAYLGEPFVTVLPFGQMPQTGDVSGSNSALIGVALDEAAGRVLIITAIDNLVKGTAGAAIQSMNIALGLEEHLGLTTNGVAP